MTDTTTPHGGAPTLEAMAERLRFAAGAAGDAFLYRNEAEDVLAYTLTGLPLGPERDAAVAAALSRLSGPAADAAGLVDAVRTTLGAMRSVTVFVTTRERIKRPEGEEWWSAQIAALEAALPVSDDTLFTPAYGEWLCKAPLMPILDAILSDPPAATEVAETDDEILDDFALALAAENPARNELRDARQAVLSRMKGTSR